MRSTPAPSWILAVVAALLPWLTVVVPIRSTWKDLAVEEFLLDEGSIGLLAMTLLFGVTAVLSLVPAARRWWGWCAAGVSLASAVVLAVYTVPGQVNWDGVDSQGRPTGGVELILPDFGWGILVLAWAAMTAAAVIALVTRRRAASARASGQALK
ncbi:MAG: hypothetical protein SOH99_08020 [Acidipropionibacterium acidipropionici]|jgi:hypothetical protein|uniref:hypothetical protein n=1 Tax=Acidipropionibacterium acidipropionici TaxID=1748 RepID=UPI002F35C00A